jgi:hypothetical protein
MSSTGFKPDQLEAIEIISKLFSIQDSLKRSDRAFIAGWKNYILKNGNDFRVGKYRLKNLQAVADTYSITFQVSLIASQSSEDTQMTLIQFDDDTIEERKEASFFEKLPLKQRREVLRKQLGLAV